MGSRVGLDSTAGDIHQGLELNEHCTLLIKNLILVSRSEDIRERQTLDADKLTEIGGGAGGQGVEQANCFT